MKKIGKYTVRGLLGRGGMSKVYKVEIPVIGKICALKIFSPNPLLVEAMGIKKLKDLFVSEAILMARLRHPNLVDIWDFDRTGDDPFYLMDYYCNNLGVMIGETYLTDRPSRIIAVDKALRYIRQILTGAAAMHHAGIIHRDIKPFNILITDQDTIKISDFGLSVLRGEKWEGPKNIHVGSPWYAAPEQEIDPNNVEFSADLFPIGIMLYRMLTGNLPAAPMAPASKWNPDLDADWDGFLEKATAANPRERFTGAAEMLHALDGLHISWNQKKERICELQAEGKPPESLSKQQTIRPRKKSLKVGPRQAKAAFPIDELWRPAFYVANRLKTKKDGTIADETTGLLWQRSGSEYPVNWNMANQYVDQLNGKTFAGRTEWRMPTVEELLSLVTEPPSGEDFCIEPVFDRTQKTLWSCDRRSFTSAWYVSLDLGFVSWQDFTCTCYVRAVCDD